jgi:uncharacterized repeat protein (TIGR03803 family)
MKRNLLLIITLFCLGIGTTQAQFTDIYNFNGTKGSEPFGTLIVDSNGVLYGTAYLGGANDSGCVFSIHTDGTHYKDLFDFAGPNGSEPNSPLTLIGGKLFGSANAGGAHDSGCVFSMDTNGTNYKDLFDFTGPNGKNPYNSLIFDSNSAILYGVADGGANHVGCIFSIDTNGSGYRDLFDFVVATGEYPLGLTLLKNKLYGAAYEGGLYTYGCVFSIDTSGGNSYKDLFNFDNTNGLYPSGPLTYGSGKLYGATSFGGSHGYGEIFYIDTNGSNFTDVFNFNFTNGYEPEYAGGALILSGNELYGTTYSGGAHDSGCIFSLDAASGYRDLFDFTGPNGANPEGSLTLIGSTLYGATAIGGTNYQGTIFAFDTAIPVLHAIRDTVCPGDSVLLYVSGISGANYDWIPFGAHNDSIYEKPVNTTIFTVTTTQGVTTYTDTITVTVIPLPAPVISGTSYVCKGHRDTLTVSGVTNYKWSNGKTSGTGYFTGPINADSTVYLTAYNGLGCSVTDTFKITVDTSCHTVGISEIQYANQFRLFPNPNNGTFTLSYYSEHSEESVPTMEVYNVLGERVYNEILLSGNNTVNLGNEPEGIYLYRVLDENGNSLGAGKLIIQK